MNYKRTILLMFSAIVLPVSVYAQDMPVPVDVPTETVQQMRVDHEGISFAFDPLLANSVTAATYPAVTDEGPPPSPAFTEFTLNGYSQGEYLNYAPQPRIDIFPIEDFGPYPYFIDQLDQLNQLLAERPDLNRYVAAEWENIGDLSLPFLPVFAAGQILRSMPEYIQVDNIEGIRYLVHYAQAPNGITEGEVFYTFQGISKDGQYYVSLILPVDTGVISTLEAPGMAMDNADTFAQEYQQYLNDVVGTITATQASTFSPALPVLDALVQSVEVKR